ncbi:unnamed protein product [Soboliphyme baturini]|uniref:Uncharacterized protein n=1 Tax=Soboliphyme baturini TaxID=241478 RepID=A0A183IKX1_9BILA|nr:unnamed protein product [Soboliphyme baturini]
MIVTKAADAWRFLNGVFCIYKPADFTMNTVRRLLCKAICDDLNNMELDSPQVYLRPILKENPVTLELRVEGHLPSFDYSEHPLAYSPTTWTFPVGRLLIQLVIVLINRQWRSKLLETRVRRGTCIGSDHHTIVAEIPPKLAV